MITNRTSSDYAEALLAPLLDIGFTICHDDMGNMWNQVCQVSTYGVSL